MPAAACPLQSLPARFIRRKRVPRDRAFTQVNAAVKEIDEGGDGNIQWEEFLSFMAKQLTDARHTNAELDMAFEGVLGTHAHCARYRRFAFRCLFRASRFSPRVPLPFTPPPRPSPAA